MQLMSPKKRRKCAPKKEDLNRPSIDFQERIRRAPPWAISLNAEYQLCQGGEPHPWHAREGGALKIQAHTPLCFFQRHCPKTWFPRPPRDSPVPQRRLGKLWRRSAKAQLPAGGRRNPRVGPTAEGER